MLQAKDVTVAATAQPIRFMTLGPPEFEKPPAGIRVLVVEDDPGHFTLILKYLAQDERSSFNTRHAETLGAAMEKLRGENFDVVLLDLSLPDSHGLETFDRVYKAANGVPIIPITALDDHNAGQELIRSGAQDFITKTELVEGFRIGHSIRYAIERNRFQHDIQQRSAKLQLLLGDLESFSYTLIHDLRAPLRSVSGFIEALTTEYAPGLDQTARGYLDRIKTAASRMDGLIMDVLSLTSTAQPEVKTEPVNLEKVITVVFQDYPSVTVSQVEFLIERPLAKVRGNFALLTLCVSNLLDNAVKFVAPGRKAKVRIWTEQGDSWVQLKIQDDGIGIPGELLGRIFEAFQRGHPQAGYKGSGIGLTIVKKAVERMSGKIWVESEVGKGSTFVIELPLGAATSRTNEHQLPADSVLNQEPLDEEQPSEEKICSRDHLLILQVEDEETDMLLLKRTLKKTELPNRLHWARDGREAADYLEGSGKFHDGSKFPLPGIIILDLKMPRMNGFELLAWLNTHPEMRDIPRIVLTSSNLDEDVIKASQLGATTYMIKPHDSNALEKMVQIISDYWALNVRPATQGRTMTEHAYMVGRPAEKRR